MATIAAPNQADISVHHVHSPNVAHSVKLLCDNIRVFEEMITHLLLGRRVRLIQSWNGQIHGSSKRDRIGEEFIINSVHVGSGGRVSLGILEDACDCWLDKVEVID